MKRFLLILSGLCLPLVAGCDQIDHTLRQLHHKKGVYAGRHDHKLSDEQLDRLRERAWQQNVQ